MMFLMIAFILLLFLYFRNIQSIYRIYMFSKTLRRDLTLLWGLLKIRFWFRRNINKFDSVPKLFDKTVKKYSNNVMCYFENQSWTYNDMHKFTNQIANYFKSKGFVKGDTVALLLANRPEYFGIWLGLSKIGVVTALININLMSDVLIHVIKTPKSKALIYGSEFSKVVSDILPSICIELYEFTDTNKQLPHSIDLSKNIKSQSNTTPKDIDLNQLTDRLIYIYTSGTTGLPKAAIITHQKYIAAGKMVNTFANLNPHDIYYNPLPLYHSIGVTTAGSQCVLFGIANVLKKKFSAINYFTDCQKYNCSVSLYIGEICRYILAAHKSNGEVKHPVRKMIGGGLRSQIWKEFVETFHIKHIYEGFTASEGNCLLVNIDNKVGAVGFIPFYSKLIYPYVTLIRCDTISGICKRNIDGFCTECDVGESGLLISEIDPTKLVNTFELYTDKDLSMKKILCDVFKKGDFYFNSGDILERDELNYLYFKDRTGDTFRWKGENVSTHEIEAIISNFLELKNATVYGVKIPNTEGRAGMVAIADKNNELNLTKLSKFLKAKLPSYAIPLFVRQMDSLQLTSTFKFQKVKLQMEGFDVNQIKDKLYFFDNKLNDYIELTKNLYENIINGNVRI